MKNSVSGQIQTTIASANQNHIARFVAKFSRNFFSVPIVLRYTNIQDPIEKDFFDLPALRVPIAFRSVQDNT
jgi:hypothetical protein